MVSKVFHFKTNLQNILKIDLGGYFFDYFKGLKGLACTRFRFSNKGIRRKMLPVMNVEIMSLKIVMTRKTYMQHLTIGILRTFYLPKEIDSL